MSYPLTEVPDLEEPPAHRAPAIHGPPDPVQVEADLLRLCDELEDASVQYHDICRNVALAEIAYERSFHAAMVEQLFDKLPERMKVSVATHKAMDEKELAALAVQRQKSSYAYLQSLHERIGALRTIAANYRKGIGA